MGYKYIFYIHVNVQLYSRAQVQNINLNISNSKKCHNKNKTMKTCNNTETIKSIVLSNLFIFVEKQHILPSFILYETYN